MKFSVLMSVYEKEKPEFLRESLESILVNQTMIPTEVVLVEDGPLNQSLYSILEEFKSRFSFFKTIALEKNSGLGIALNEGLKHCNYEWVCTKWILMMLHIHTRFEKQVNFIKQNPTIDIEIDEFLNSTSEIVSHKNVPTQHDEILKMARREKSMCHMTVMFKKKSVERAGGYQTLPYVEDYFLWVRMIASGSKFANIDETLVLARVGNGMFNRRGNREQINSWTLLIEFMLAQGIVTPLDVFINQIYIRVFVYMPTWIKKLIYGKILRK
uniref:Cps9G n=1 Tax=Streptococcus suis TaxID=1307 RepID=Q9RG40_STRSU|nr:Cps9G [Streptococcus suis]AEH57495.1 Cps9G [Streptococcus suis]FAA00948.1 TPA: glycosyltransferase [Streptococcus suis]